MVLTCSFNPVPQAWLSSPRVMTDPPAPFDPSSRVEEPGHSFPPPPWQIPQWEPRF